MIVFGDPSFAKPARELVQSLAAEVATLCAEKGGADCARVREALIFAGQVEQALADECDARPGADSLEGACVWAASCTDALARALVLRAPAQVVPAPPRTPATPVTVKVPEGFAFYALFPDQYHEAACAWSCANRDAVPGPVQVVGLRSIGTTLSALVCAALAAEGWRASRTTIRPGGNQQDRRASIDPRLVEKAARVIIVDEGPGQSGTSFGATAEALARAGVPAGRIAFFPSHQNALGPAASGSARRWWDVTPKYTATSVEARLDHLRGRTRELLEEDVDEGTCLSGGLWRARVYENEGQWPGVFALLEREKFLIRGRRSRRAVLWKFGGLARGRGGGTGCTRECRRLNQLAERQLTPRLLDSALGFYACEWAEGRPLGRGDLSSVVLDRIAEYLVAAPAPALSREQARSALERLKVVLYWNTRKGLGEVAARGAAELCETVKSLDLPTSTAAAPDGRLAPHEWLLTTSGRIVKADAAGHADDHTIVGPQPLAWDLAGAAVEWDLSAGQLARLLTRLGTHPANDLRPGLLRFCTAAYAAFKLGYCAMGADCAGGDEAERARLKRDQGCYERHLRRALAGIG